jgi:hypothetical protein
MLDSKGKDALHRFARFRGVSQCFCPIPKRSPSASALFGGIGNLVAATLQALAAGAPQSDR